MPLKIETVTLPFKDEDGEDTDATYTIRRRISRDAQMEYLKLAAKFDITVDEDGKAHAGVHSNDLDIQAITDLLLKRGLVSLHNVQDIDGQDLPIERFGTFDSDYVQQVVRELQQRNTGDGTSPKLEAPSGTS